MLAGYLGRTDQSDTAIADYAVAYANEIERDYKTLISAAKTDVSPSRLATASR